jgi:amidohydrolase
VTHACGHDVHTTVVLGAALALHDLFGRDGQPLPVRLVFQPAEERLPGGAVEVIAAGGLDAVSEIYGVHCDPRLPAGQVGLTAGPITSATDAVTIRLGGPGGHTARPERTVDLIGLAGLVAVELPARIERVLGGRAARITFGSLHAGDAANVIPSSAELRGTARTPDIEVWDALEEGVRQALAELVEPQGATWELVYRRGHPPVVNDPVATAHMVDATRILLGEDAVRPTHQSVGGDDFSWYLDRVPGCYARLGVADPDTGAAPADLHAHEFDVDERCIATGIRLLVGTVLTSLGARPRRPSTPS